MQPHCSKRGYLQQTDQETESTRCLNVLHHAKRFMHYVFLLCNIIMLCWMTTCDSCTAVREDAQGRVQKTNQETESVLQSMSSNITTHSCLPLQLTLIANNSKHIPNTLAQLLPFCTPSTDKAIVIWRNAPTSTITFSSSIRHCVSGCFHTVVKSCITTGSFIVASSTRPICHDMQTLQPRNYSFGGHNSNRNRIGCGN